MRLRNHLFKLLAGTFLVALPACGGDSGTGPSPGPTFENIAGSYAGVLAGISQGVALEATFSIAIQQSAGDLSGSSSLVGTLSDGVILVAVQGSGTFTGTIASGLNPSVNITTASSLCPNHRPSFSGSFDSANNVLTLNGPIDIVDDNCDVVLTFPSVIVLSR